MLQQCVHHDFWWIFIFLMIFVTCLCVRRCPSSSIVLVSYYFKVFLQDKLTLSKIWVNRNCGFMKSMLLAVFFFWMVFPFRFSLWSIFKRNFNKISRTDRRRVRWAGVDWRARRSLPVQDLRMRVQRWKRPGAARQGSSSSLVVQGQWAVTSFASIWLMTCTRGLNISNVYLNFFWMCLFRNYQFKTFLFSTKILI